MHYEALLHFQSGDGARGATRPTQFMAIPNDLPNDLPALTTDHGSHWARRNLSLLVEVTERLMELLTGLLV